MNGTKIGKGKATAEIVGSAQISPIVPKFLIKAVTSAVPSGKMDRSKMTNFLMKIVKPVLQRGSPSWGLTCSPCC